MPQIFRKLSFRTSNQIFFNITSEIERNLKDCAVKNGLLNLSVLHTSCSLMIQENADPLVLKDIKNFLEKLAPEQDYFHNSEGPDDMPAHLKSLITQTNLTLSVKDYNLTLGTWQGIFLLEHRISDRIRDIQFHLMG
ncbi:MAG: secondary thiamine-phosphate synthase enzyme YjbQ [Pseudomonadota bacterium]|nr:secondary thiamine-phosphate synthase enzyme YjbQ [Pseudomonadota bacterium]